MNWGYFYLFRIASVVMVVITTSVAGNFAPPAQGPIAFRRDQIPLDADTMVNLSRVLVTLAQAVDRQSAAERRTIAQMLALSLALDPGNTKARNFISEMQHNPHPEYSATDGEQVESGQKRIWQILEWLETPEAGNQGHALADCLRDVMVVSDPRHPKSETTRSPEERGAWQGWIPQLAAYEPPVALEEIPPKTDNPDEPRFLLNQARVFTVAWKKTQEGAMEGWNQVIVPLQMVTCVPETGGEKNETHHPATFDITICPQPGKSSFHELSATLVKLFKSQTSVLPAGRIIIDSPNLELSNTLDRLQPISAAAAVLVSAAITGREPDATILGVVDEEGNFKLPIGFWSQLLALGPGNGSRLVLPNAAAEYLPSMLALERPQIFLEYEIFLASNFEELLQLTAKIPDPSFEKSMASFREIREKSGIQALGQYIANPYVRKRLAEIVMANSNHFSAKMLAIQGSGNRPIHVSQEVLAFELYRAIRPMEWIIAKTNSDFDPEELGRLEVTSSLCRTQMDHLARYTAKDSRILFDQVQDMVTGIRTLDRAARARVGYSNALVSSYEALVTSHRGVVEKLTAIIGESPLIAAP